MAEENKEVESTVDEAQEPTSVATPTETPSGGKPNAFNLHEDENFRRYQSEMDKQLAAAKQQAEEARKSAEEARKRMEAMESSRDYDVSQLDEMREFLEQRKGTEQRASQMLNQWRGAGLNETDSPAVVARLKAADTPQDVDRIVYEWLNDRLHVGKSKTDGRKEISASGVDAAPAPESTTGEPVDDLSVKVNELRRQAKTGKNVLREWLQTTDPTAGSQQRQGGPKVRA